MYRIISIFLLFSIITRPCYKSAVHLSPLHSLRRIYPTAFPYRVRHHPSRNKPDPTPTNHAPQFRRPDRGDHQGISRGLLAVRQGRVGDAVRHSFARRVLILCVCKVMATSPSPSWASSCAIWARTLRKLS